MLSAAERGVAATDWKTANTIVASGVRRTTAGAGNEQSGIAQAAPGGQSAGSRPSANAW